MLLSGLSWVILFNEGTKDAVGLMVRERCECEDGLEDLDLSEGLSYALLEGGKELFNFHPNNEERVSSVYGHLI